jgi:hypothetical protein
VGLVRNIKLLGALAALALFATANSAADATTTAYTYSLNGTLAEDSGSGPSLVAYGGTLTPSGYYFGPNTGLSLSNAINTNVYSIDIHFYFDSVTASSNGFQRIMDFKNRTTDRPVLENEPSGIEGRGDCLQCRINELCW